MYYKQVNEFGSIAVFGDTTDVSAHYQCTYFIPPVSNNEAIPLAWANLLCNSLPYQHLKIGGEIISIEKTEYLGHIKFALKLYEARVNSDSYESRISTDGTIYDYSNYVLTGFPTIAEAFSSLYPRVLNALAKHITGKYMKDDNDSFAFFKRNPQLTLFKISTISASDLLRLRNVGKGTIEEIRSITVPFGIDLLP